jgi:hypothetical protein
MRDESEAEATWHAGRPCQVEGCVEIAAWGGKVIIRSSLAVDLTLTITRAEWQAFLDGAKEGLFDEL